MSQWFYREKDTIEANITLHPSFRCKSHVITAKFARKNECDF